jgi:hypothetical protein
MADRINDIAWQAHQGSVAAIIQVLNEKLAMSGVRTRAIFADGVLQLLCEARTLDKLEKSTLVTQIQQILESIAPRNIHRVNINSRIVREQQLLWLEEINRDPENQLLWSEEITLEKPNIVKQLIADFKERQPEVGKLNLPNSQSSRLSIIPNRNKPKKSFWGGMLEVSSLCVVLILLGWGFYGLVGGKLKNPIQSEMLKSFVPATKSLEPANINQNQPEAFRENTQGASIPSEDPFAEAVRIANQNVVGSKTAQNSSQWLDLAARWQRASELMSKVPPSHSRYKEAQIRTKLYRQYSEASQKEADKSKS